MKRDLNKEIIQTVIDSLKSILLDEDKVLDVYDKKETDSKTNGELKTSFNSGNFQFNIKVKYFQRVRIFYKNVILNNLTIGCEARGYSGDSKNYQFNSDGNYEEMKQEIFDILYKKNRDDEEAEENKKDLKILESLEESVDRQFKREDTIDKILEGH